MRLTSRPARRNGSIKPPRSISSSTPGWRTVARVSVCGTNRLSAIRGLMPWRSSSQAANNPPGPAPMIRTEVVPCAGCGGTMLPWRTAGAFDSRVNHNGFCGYSAMVLTAVSGSCQGLARWRVPCQIALRYTRFQTIALSLCYPPNKPSCSCEFWNARRRSSKPRTPPMSATTRVI